MKATTLRRLRQFHLYIAIFFAPAIIFFAFSGLLQTYGLHEARGAPAWIGTIASLHQHQRLRRPERPRPAAAKGDHDADHDHGDHDAPPSGGFALGLVAIKLFTGLMALGLVVASGLGIVIALATRSTRRVSSVMLTLGLVVPAAFILA